MQNQTLCYIAYKMKNISMEKNINVDILRQNPENALFYLNPDFPLHGGNLVTLSDINIKQLHIHNVFEIGFCSRGKGIFVIEDKVIPFTEGDVFIINHLEMHRACMPDGVPSEWYFLLTDPVHLLSGTVSHDPLIADTELLSGSHFPNKFSKNEFPEIYERVMSIINEIRSKNKHYKESIRANLSLLLVELSRFRDKLPKDNTTKRRSITLMNRLSPALTKIACDYAESLSIEQLAQSCFVGTGHFRRLFHEAFKKSPLDYIHDYRMNMVCSFLSTTERSITEIAMNCGYASLSCFNRQFQKHKGISPREWREKNQPNYR